MTADAQAAGAERPASVSDDHEARFQPFPKSGEIDPREPGLDPGFGVPPPPAANAPTALRCMWDRMFGSRLSMRKFEVTPQLLERPPPAIRRHVIEVVNLPGSVQDSRNWAGAYATANGDEHLHTMFGLWQIPPSLDIPPDSDPADFACSIWIGLDGQRRYFDSSLPQIGTLSTIDLQGKRLASAWVQWWQRDNPNNQILPLDLPVGPGDTVGCFLHATGLHDAWFVMVNLSTPGIKPAVAFKALAPNSIDGVEPAIFGATAEWIVERPTKLHTTTMFELPDFGRCHIDGLALQVPAVGQAQWFEGTLRDFSYARTIRMVEQRADPSRTAIIALPHRAGPVGIEVTYGGF